MHSSPAIEVLNKLQVMLIGNASLLKIMDADQGDPMLSSSCSKPLHVQRVERATDLNVFLQERRKEKLPVCSSDEEAIIVDENPTENFDFLNGTVSLMNYDLIRFYFEVFSVIRW